MAKEEIILEAAGLTKEFKGFIAVKNVNLRVRRHTIHALIGPNGAGKTTIFYMITGLVPADEGAISIDGADVRSVTLESLRRAIATLAMPANVPTGSYAIDVKLFAEGTLVSRTNTALEVIKAGFEQYVADAARAELVRRLLSGDSAVWVLMENQPKADDVAQRVVARRALRVFGGQLRMGEEAERAEPVVEPDDDEAALGGDLLEDLLPLALVLALEGFELLGDVLDRPVEVDDPAVGIERNVDRDAAAANGRAPFGDTLRMRQPRLVRRSLSQGSGLT